MTVHDWFAPLSLAPTLLHDRYKIVRVLGQTGSSTVYQARDTLASTERYVAIKQYRDTKVAPFNEFRLLSSLEHHGIPHVHGLFADQVCWHLVLDYIAGQTLRAYAQDYPAGRLSLEETCWIGLQLTSILDELHQHGIVHADVTPENILHAEEDGHIVLVDYVTATTCEQTEHAGSRRYAPPEQHHGLVDCRSDIYALGVVLHELLTGTTTALDPQTPIADFPLASTEPYTTLRELLFEMMHYDAQKRPQDMAAVAMGLLRVRW